jgi:hypothetical protein
MWFMAHRSENVTIRSLSMQQIVDCDRGHGDEGCNGTTPKRIHFLFIFNIPYNVFFFLVCVRVLSTHIAGGDTTTAYEYVIRAGGLELYQDYPYTARDGTCKFESSKISVSISSWSYVRFLHFQCHRFFSSHSRLLCVVLSDESGRLRGTGTRRPCFRPLYSFSFTATSPAELPLFINISSPCIATTASL